MALPPNKTADQPASNSEQVICPVKEGVVIPRPRYPAIRLREEALIYYCYEHPDVSISKMSEIEPFKDAVSKRTMEKWAAKDGWADRRRRAQEQWASTLKKELGDRFVQARINHLKALERVFKKALDKLNSNVVECSSWEGLLSATGRISAQINKWHQLLEDELPKEQPEQHFRPNLTQEEAEAARAAAHAVIKLRREAHRRMLEQQARAQNQGGDSPEKDPRSHVHVVK